MSNLRQTIKSYEDRGESYLRQKDSVEKDSHSLLRKFKKLVKGQSILEIGFGVGNDAEWFLDNRFFYTGVEPVLKFCKNLHAKFPWINILNSDVREIEFRPETFDGIWAMASLIHLEDEDLSEVLKKFHSWLKKDGIVYISLKEGRKKITTEDGRYFNLYTRSRFLPLTKDQFKLVNYSVTKPKKHNSVKTNWLNFYLKKI